MLHKLNNLLCFYLLVRQERISKLHLEYLVTKFKSFVLCDENISDSLIESYITHLYDNYNVKFLIIFDSYFGRNSVKSIYNNVDLIGYHPIYRIEVLENVDIETKKEIMYYYNIYDLAYDNKV